MERALHVIRMGDEHVLLHNSLLQTLNKIFRIDRHVYSQFTIICFKSNPSIDSWDCFAS